MTKLSKQQIEEKLVAHFSGSEVFSKKDLFRFYEKYEPDLNKGTFGWRIYDLKQKHVIKNVRTGYYTLEQKKTFKPQTDNVIIQLASELTHSNNDTKYCIWTTAWLNDFIELQATSFLYILEVEKESANSIFYSLRDAGFTSNLFLKPDKNVMEHYVSEFSKSIIVETLFSRSPVMKVEDIVYPTIEKILVDLFCDKQLFFAYQGRQLVKIYDACLSKYYIDFSKLLNYAGRRKREGEIKRFFSNNTELNEKIKGVIE